MPDYRLTTRQRINKVWYEAGAVVALPAQTGDWQVEQGRATRVDAPVSSAPQRAPVAPPAVTPAPRFDPPPVPSCCNWRK